MNPQQPNRQLFESIFKHATLGILVTNARGAIILINRFALQEFGYSESELQGQAIEKLIPNRFHPQHTAERTAYQERPSTRPMGAGRDLFGLKKDGTEFPVEVSLSPFQSGDETYVIAFIINITARKEKEASEKKYQQQISTILSSLRKEKELNDMKSNFVSMASHEFKTPLSTILSSASLLSKYTLTEEQQQREKHIERIKSAVRNLNGILNEFLSISKIEDGKIGVRYTDFDLAQFISGICTEMEDMLQPQQTIRCQHQGEKLVSLDMELLRNILSNLISNAIKFSGAQGQILVDSRCSPQKTVIRIQDNGFGIPEEDQVHLFERFFRGSNVLTIPGTGLGLHIVSKYVKLMKGTIRVQSSQHQGTEIILTFKQ